MELPPTSYILECTYKQVYIPIEAPVPEGVVAFGAGRRPALQDSQEVKSSAEVLLGITGD